MRRGDNMVFMLDFPSRPNSTASKRKHLVGGNRRPIRWQALLWECEVCGVRFTSRTACRTRTPKYCSKMCGYMDSVLVVCEGPQCGDIVRWPRKNYCSRKCQHAARRGRKLSISHRQAISKAKKGKPVPSRRIPGAADARVARLLAMGRLEYRQWRRAVLKRDGCACVKCGARKKLHVDHIKPWATHPALRYTVSNGRTLCFGCHKEIDTYGWRTARISRLAHGTKASARSGSV